MKQNQKGVSVIVLVISIIVIIVLLLIAFGSSWKPIGSIAKVGDYVNYSANGVTSWRVFDIRNGEVLITPADGPVGTVKINGVDGYVTALTEIEKNVMNMRMLV